MTLISAFYGLKQYNLSTCFGRSIIAIVQIVGAATNPLVMMHVVVLEVAQQGEPSVRPAEKYTSTDVVLSALGDNETLAKSEAPD